MRLPFFDDFDGGFLLAIKGLDSTRLRGRRPDNENDDTGDGQSVHAQQATAGDVVDEKIAETRQMRMQQGQDGRINCNGGVGILQLQPNRYQYSLSTPLHR